MNDSPPLLLVRFRRGVVGETKRVVHLVAAPDGGEMPEVLTAYCGTKFRPGEADLLPGIEGRPCERCLLRAPIAGPFDLIGS